MYAKIQKYLRIVELQSSYMTDNNNEWMSGATELIDVIKREGCYKCGLPVVGNGCDGIIKRCPRTGLFRHNKCRSKQRIPMTCAVGIHLKKFV